MSDDVGLSKQRRHFKKRNFRDKGIKHEYRVRDGGHTWTYWRESLPTVLEFVSQGFHQF